MTKTPNRAVIETHAPEEVEGDTPERARWRKLNFFATPPWGTRAGAAILQQIDPAAESVWEPACGDGIMAAVLRDIFPEVHQSDIELQQGLAQHKDAFRHDFLLDEGGPEVDWIFTNPPFAYAQEFIKTGLRRARRGVAVLCRLSFLETAGRYDLHFKGDTPLTALAPFFERCDMQLGPWSPDAGTMTAYAWFFYQKQPHRKAQGFKPSAPTIIAIAPGTEAALSDPDDVRRFVTPTFGTLL